MPSVSPEKFNLAIHTDQPLRDFTTFKLGGLPKFLVHCQTTDELQRTVTFTHSNHEKFILIGGGSNLVISDAGINCGVIRYVSEQPIIKPLSDHQFRVSASTILDDFVLYAAQRGFHGINYASGIPGTIGGAIVGNAGAFGQQIAECLVAVVLVNPQGVAIEIPAAEIEFSYRHSSLKDSPDIVAEAIIQLAPGSTESLLNEREEILAIRREKHPDLKRHPCAGSFFRNIEPTSKAGRRQATGWFLEQAGGKDLRSGGAYIYPKHANIITRDDNGTAQDVFDLSQKMAQLAKERFNLDLVREVRFVGNLDGKPDHISAVIW